MKITVEMPTVSKCSASKCAYNRENKCHARAITVGDASNPKCDTFFENRNHVQSVKRIAGVGACKVTECRHNYDLVCNAQEISVGSIQSGFRCMTFEARRKDVA